jgi:hypothetical protein
MTTITVKKLIELIKGADYIDKKRKKYWLSMIPKMTINELEELVTIIANSELEKKHLEESEGYIVAGMVTIFAALNENAVKQAEKDIK